MGSGGGIDGGQVPVFAEEVFYSVYGKPVSIPVQEHCVVSGI